MSDNQAHNPNRVADNAAHGERVKRGLVSATKKLPPSRKGGYPSTSDTAPAPDSNPRPAPSSLPVQSFARSLSVAFVDETPKKRRKR